ncbi:ferredoxin--nitrite reductase [Roseofilum casamattae]|uniref:Ferredoxin--nitrite reductase n=1 Tax=Roseofilum casamattae BLCC-M143 TaxID=3022442 RepID=A0ABT7BTS2_9CYAN|nr:ferredoxin--nitrite reductase [Roseofilum casamattae]MDJ1182582.1 ferredoxin--nitrite reductase [Roseofilum casamattae BLCC-M143]
MTTTAPSNVKLNKFERFKAEKDGLAVKNELDHFASIGWEAIDETDRDQRLKWLGIFFRPVTPGKFMLRMRTPNGILTSEQVRVLAETTQRYGEDGSADITTRQNLQLRGIRLEDIPQIFQRFEQVGLTSMQSGMDNVRNITGSPVAGIDSAELIDTRSLVQQTQDTITNSGAGNPEFTNLPRKFNIAIAGGRDNSVHAEINDIAYVPAYKDGILGFNVLVGGFFSGRRCEAAIPLDAWIEPNQCVAISRAILEVYRDSGLRANRQKARLMWLIDEWGLERFRATVEEQYGQRLQPAAPKDEFDWEKRDHIGVYPQKQPGLNYVGMHVPVGRLQAPDLFEFARLAEVYGSGEIRLTVEQNIIIPNIPDANLEAFLAEPLLEKFSPNPEPLSRALVSCTGSQFCKFALIETKNRANILIEELQQELTLQEPVRIHWTGCPNSCGQPQVADIGLMGTKTRKDGKTLEGVDIFMGGKVGKDAQLGEKVMKGIPCQDLKSVLRDLLIEKFGAEPKAGYIPSITPEENGHGKTSTPSTPVGTIRFARSNKTITCYEGESILVAAEREGIDLDSSCQSGTCGTCQQTLVSGEVNYLQTPEALDNTPGSLLTCSASPVGDIVIDA